MILESWISLKRTVDFIASSTNFIIRGNMTMSLPQKFYVTMTDRFLSGWGLAKGKTSKFIVECDDYDEALTVAENAGHRSDMKNVHISSGKPYYDSSRYHVSVHTKADGSRWYQKNGF